MLKMKCTASRDDKVHSIDIQAQGSSKVDIGHTPVHQTGGSQPRARTPDYVIDTCTEVVMSHLVISAEKPNLQPSSFKLESGPTTHAAQPHVVKATRNLRSKAAPSRVYNCKITQVFTKYGVVLVI